MMEHVFIFRRDLRVEDNLGIRELCDRVSATAEQRVLPVFVLCAEQADARLNPYHSARAVRFMMAALRDLRRVLPSLVVLRGRDELEALRPFLRTRNVASISFNEDSTPYARARDDALRAWCTAEDVPCFWCAGEYSLTANGALKPYKVFTPFYRRCVATVAVPAPLAAPLPPVLAVAGVAAAGSKRAAALAILYRVRRGDFDAYAARRDDLGDRDATTRLSPHLKFGTLSVRELYHAAASRGDAGEPLVRQLYWRAFYDQLVWHFPNTLRGELLWPAPAAWGTPVNDPALLAAWKEGRTGEPLVDAAMRTLATTGYLPNRARMVAASYLIWNMRLDWREGERHFARELEDYHPSANGGNWQWLLLRQRPNAVLSPRRQAERFDKEGRFVGSAGQPT